MPAVTSILAATAIGAGLYSANQQSQAAKGAASAQKRAELEARRISAEQKPMEEAATLQTDMGGGVLGNLGLAIEPDITKKKTSNLGVASTSVGLGFGS